MLAIQLIKHARPDLACEAVDIPEPVPGAGEAVVAIKAAAINPADLLIFEGRYPGPEALPAFVGIEGAGMVEALGDGVTGLSVGDHVISLGRANWAEKICAPVESLIRIPKTLSWRDAAQLKANPPSAHLMLQDYVALEKGDWVVQNAANSAVGRHVIRFAKARGFKTANIVRRESLVEELTQLGADVVVTDDGDIASKIRAAAGEGATIRLGIDAIGGKATSAMADCLSNGGTVVNYGFIADAPCEFTPYHTVIHGLTLTGFWLVGFMSRTTRAEKEALYAEMAKAFEEGVLSSPVEAEYGLDRISEALVHAHAESRNGKILLMP